VLLFPKKRFDPLIVTIDAVLCVQTQPVFKALEEAFIPLNEFPLLEIAIRMEFDVEDRCSILI